HDLERQRPWAGTGCFNHAGAIAIQEDVPATNRRADPRIGPAKHLASGDGSFLDRLSCAFEADPDLRRDGAQVRLRDGAERERSDDHELSPGWRGVLEPRKGAMKAVW